MRRRTIAFAGLLFSLLSIATNSSTNLLSSTAKAADGPASTAPARHIDIGQIVFAEDYQAGKPVRPASQFKPGLPRVYAVFSFHGLRTDDTIYAAWFRDNLKTSWQTLGVADALGTVVETNTGHLRVWWEPDEKFIPGQYRLELSVNGQLVRQGTFVVK